MQQGVKGQREVKEYGQRGKGKQGAKGPEGKRAWSQAGKRVKGSQEVKRPRGRWKGWREGMVPCQ